MAVYAYVRKEYPVSTIEQLQLLTTYKCDQIFIEESEPSIDTELERLLEMLQSEDQLLVYDMRTFAKNSKGFKQLLEILQKNQVRLISIRDQLDTAESISFYTDVLKVLEMEEKHRAYQIKTSIKLAKLEGRVTGRPRIGEDVVKRMVFLFESKDKTLREIADICDVSLGTVHKYISSRSSSDGE